MRADEIVIWERMKAKAIRNGYTDPAHSSGHQLQAFSPYYLSIESLLPRGSTRFVFAASPMEIELPIRHSCHFIFSPYSRPG